MKNFIIFLIFLLFTFSSLESREIKGIDMPDALKSGNENLVLNGAGVIKKLLFKVYIIGLYVQQKTSDENELLNQDKSYIIRLHFVRNGVTSDKIIDAWNTGFSKATGAKTDNIKNEIKQFNSWFDKDEVNENDIFQFDYKSGTGVRVYINGKLKGTIGGFAFRKALLGIWLGSNPRDEGVKEDLLGK
ncbi:MAG: chalcone isomerase family protein [Bacteroidota bacterium]